MQQSIYDTNDTFDFNKIHISKPISSSNGVFILKTTVDEKPLYVNPPKCSLKLSAKGTKRTHCDFIFSQENDQFIRWIENLEKIVQDKIYENRSQWFETDLEKEDIENYFTSSLKIYKSGKYYLLRTNLPNPQQRQSFKIYDENENEIQFDSITDTMQIMCVLEVQGIKFASNNFQIEMIVKQMMVLQPVDLFNKCILKKITNSSPIVVLKDLENIENKPNVENKKYEITEEDKEEHESEVDKPEQELNDDDEKNKSTLEKMEENSNEMPTDKIEYVSETSNELCEVDFDIEQLDVNDSITIKQRNVMYYEMYMEARRKAKIARDLALSAYLEARRIKNTYMLEDILDSDDNDESDIDELEQLENE